MNTEDRTHAFVTVYAIILLMAFALNEIWVTAAVGLFSALPTIYLIEREQGRDWLKGFWDD